MTRRREDTEMVMMWNLSWLRLHLRVCVCVCVCSGPRRQQMSAIYLSAISSMRNGKWTCCRSLSTLWAVNSDPVFFFFRFLIYCEPFRIGWFHQNAADFTTAPLETDAWMHFILIWTLNINVVMVDGCGGHCKFVCRRIVACDTNRQAADFIEH